MDKRKLIILIPTMVVGILFLSFVTATAIEKGGDFYFNVSALGNLLMVSPKGTNGTVIDTGEVTPTPTVIPTLTPTPTTEKLRFVFMIHGDGTMQDGFAADFEKCISDSIRYIESQSPIRIERVDYNVEKAGHNIEYHEEKKCSWLGGKDIADQYPNFPEGHVHFLFWQNPTPPAPGVCYGGMCFNEWIEKPSYRIPHPLAMVPYRIPKWWWGDYWLGSEKGCACFVTHEIHHVLEYELHKKGYPTSHNLGEHIHGKTVPFADAQSTFGFTDQKAFNDFMWNEITEEMVKSLSPTPTPTPTPIPDSDDDGWDNEQERRARTNPYNVDTDGDGIWDPKDPNPLVAPTPTPTTSVSAFQIIPAIVALFAVAYLLRRRK